MKQLNGVVCLRNRGVLQTMELAENSKIALIKSFIILLSLLTCFAFVCITKNSLVYSDLALFFPLTAGENKTIRAQWETSKAFVLVFVRCRERNADFSRKYLLTHLI